MRTIAKIEVKIDIEELQQFTNKSQEIQGICDDFINNSKDLVQLGLTSVTEYRKLTHSWITNLAKRGPGNNNNNDNHNNSNKKHT